MKTKERELLLNSQELNVEQRATQLIREMGISVSLKGYGYLRTAVVLAVLYPNLQCTQLYIMIADEVERDPKVWKDLFDMQLILYMISTRSSYRASFRITLENPAIRR